MEELELRERLEKVLNKIEISLENTWSGNPIEDKKEIENELVKLFFEGFSKAHEVGMEVGMYKILRT